MFKALAVVIFAATMMVVADARYPGPGDTGRDSSEGGSKWYLIETEDVGYFIIFYKYRNGPSIVEYSSHSQFLAYI